MTKQVLFVVAVDGDAVIKSRCSSSRVVYYYVFLLLRRRSLFRPADGEGR